MKKIKVAGLSLCIRKLLFDVSFNRKHMPHQSDFTNKILLYNLNNYNNFFEKIFIRLTDNNYIYCQLKVLHI